jgi:hypothetical protein
MVILTLTLSEVEGEGEESPYFAPATTLYPIGKNALSS